MMTADSLAGMADAWTAFDEALREGRGVDQNAYAALKETLRLCAQEWEALDAIPRLAANILVDIFAATEANAALYQGAMADQAMEAAYELHDLAGACVALQ
ncbi:hypothetical protein [Streptomyces sp. NPDC002913]